MTGGGLRGGSLSWHWFGFGNGGPKIGEEPHGYKSKDNHNRESAKAQQTDDRQHQDRTQSQTQVAPHGKYRHPGSHFVASKEMGGFIALRMIRRHPQTADEHQQQHPPKIVRNSQERQPHPGRQTTQRQEQGLFLLVGEIAEQRLQDGRGKIGGH